MRKRVIAAVIFLLFVGVGGFVYGKGIPQFRASDDERQGSLRWSRPEVTEQAVTETVTTEAPLLTVYICGEVNRPGVYDLPTDGRLCDAVALAGGVTGSAAADSVNMAEPLADGMRYYIPARAESEEGVLYEDPSDERINLNTATKEELMTLSGIGEARAESILAYREANGKFRSIEELCKVSGISEKILAQIQDRIRVK